MFLSHSTRDNTFCARLANDLTRLGVPVWYDQWEIKVGDSLRQKIASGIDEQDYLIVVLSKASVGSQWVQVELNAALARELEQQHVFVLPVLIEECEIPTFLLDKKYANFKSDYRTGISELANVLNLKLEDIPLAESAHTPTSRERRLDELALLPDDFGEWYMDALESGNQIQLARFMNNWRDALVRMPLEEHVTEEAGRQLLPTDETLILLEKLAHVGFLLVRFEQESLFSRLAAMLNEAFWTINQRGTSSGASSDWNVPVAMARSKLMDVIVALGAAIVDASLFTWLGHLLRYRGADDDYWGERSWFMYTTVMSARVNGTRGSTWFYLVPRAANFINERPFLSSQLRIYNEPLSVVCQFDLIQSLYWYYRSPPDDAFRRVFPNCVYYEPRRVEPMIRRILDKEEPRQLIGDFTDDSLGDTLLEFKNTDASRFGGAGWSLHSWRDKHIIALFAEASKRSASR